MRRTLPFVQGQGFTDCPDLIQPHGPGPRALRPCAMWWVHDGSGACPGPEPRRARHRVGVYPDGDVDASGEV